MIKFEHSVFALPFALLAMVMAAGGLPPAPTVGWIVLACVFARSAAMSFNRLHDERFDRLNPRTRGWALPAGLLTRRFVWTFMLLCCAGFIAAAAMLNRLALALSPVALAIVLGYSTAKRWTAGSHFLLGLALGIAPVGAWIGVRGALGLPPVLLAAGVVLWVAGFDIIYSCQDEAFDRRMGLFSLPARLGRRRALALSALCHAVAAVMFLVVAWAGGLGAFYLTA
ncbi:MAG: putative 4-hydroxybenzoate polyprenyltransferase, partial [bacterium]|nr:putative 4-hydroxybenzoate polyprenyltransferase [bacterium]